MKIIFAFCAFCLFLPPSREYQDVSYSLHPIRLMKAKQPSHFSACICCPTTVKFLYLEEYKLVNFMEIINMYGRKITLIEIAKEIRKWHKEEGLLCLEIQKKRKQLKD